MQQDNPTISGEVYCFVIFTTMRVTWF